MSHLQQLHRRTPSSWCFMPSSTFRTSWTFLNFQYNLSKKLEMKPVRWLSASDRQLSGLFTQTYHPKNPDEMSRVFRTMDHDGDGKISSEDLEWLLKALKVKEAKKEAKEMISAADMDKDGFISFNEFKDVHRKGVRASEIQRAFRVFDVNEDGRISAEEVKEVMESLGMASKLEECRRMVREVDKSGKGLVDMDDFIIMMTCTMRLES